MSGKQVVKALRMLGPVTKEEILKNNTNGAQWMSALATAQMQVQQEFPKVDGMRVSGSRAHQSHTTAHHTNVLSIKYFEGAVKAVSGHIHLNGFVEYGGGRSL
ncbi:hypothetical protein C8A05DRAFT_20229 [Staphylotrichum tortipilum]|uniref:Uncharacterized protein n=1 Tax=Staphylotrichum tortipilum TaxID=2831512 RepID=A0AAN6MAM3_9PEZI|nr:hypothetical protein C8A05DRAFT_20229 [Staphylotrichum longicolle]